MIHGENYDAYSNSRDLKVLCNTLSIGFRGHVDAGLMLKRMLHSSDEHPTTISCSAGSACNSSNSHGLRDADGGVPYSSVLKEMGVTGEVGRATLRVSCYWWNTIEEGNLRGDGLHMKSRNS